MEMSGHLRGSVWLVSSKWRPQKLLSLAVHRTVPTTNCPAPVAVVYGPEEREEWRKVAE